MPLSPNAVHDLAEAVLCCVCAALDAAAADVPGQPGCPCRTCVVPGAAAWDSCDADEACRDEDGGAPGQLTVGVARLYPAGPAFPSEDRTVQGVRGCTPPQLTAVELVITLLRCAPTVDESGCPPSCEEHTEAACTLHPARGRCHDLLRPLALPAFPRPQPAPAPPIRDRRAAHPRPTGRLRRGRTTGDRRPARMRVLPGTGRPLMSVQVRVDPGAVARLLRLRNGPVERRLRDRTQRVADITRREAPGTMGAYVDWRVEEGPRGLQGVITCDHPAVLYVLDGTRPHLIRPRRASALRFEIGGRAVYTKLVRHPGTRADNFLGRAAVGALTIDCGRGSIC